MASDKFTTCDSTMIPEHLYFFILFLLVLNFFHIFFMRIYSIFSRNTRPLFLWGKNKRQSLCVRIFKYSRLNFFCERKKLLLFSTSERAFSCSNHVLLMFRVRKAAVLAICVFSRSCKKSSYSIVRIWMRGVFKF